METLAIELECSTDAALEAVSEASEAWGAGFETSGTGGRIELPVTAGVRHGFVDGRVAVRAPGSSKAGSAVELYVEREDYRLHRSSAFMLLLGALGGVAVVLLPFFPALFDFLPFAGLMMLLAWFLVVARVRHRTPRDFLELVRQIAEGDLPKQKGLVGAPSAD